jgi:hypothetical protein
MMQLLHLFLENDFSVTFASASRESEYSTKLQQHGITSVPVLLNDAGFDTFLHDLSPTVVLFDRFTSEEQFGWRVAEHCPDALRILDTEDLHFLRAARQQALKENRALQNSDLHSDTAKREIAAIYRSDLSLIISAFELDLLVNYFNIDKNILHYLPLFAGPVNRELERSKADNLKKILIANRQLPEFSQRRNFVSIGNFLHEPNWDAVLFLKKEIWPLLRKKLPQAEMHVYGAYPTQKVFELNDPSTGFLIKGRAPDADEVLRNARVCLAPLRFGAGLKGKLMDAMRNGTPNVTTPIGVEGMQVTPSVNLPGRLPASLDPLPSHSLPNANESLSPPPWSGAIATNPTEFADAACKLYTDESLWHEAQSTGFYILHTLFSKENHQKPFFLKLLDTENNLNTHRLQNFTGAMLMQHFSQSTKYMSLWIEQKNKQQKEAE